MKNAQVMTLEGLEALKEEIKLKDRATEILNLVVSEWDSDPMSVQCFDLKIVKEAKQLTKRLQELSILND